MRSAPNAIRSTLDSRKQQQLADVSISSIANTVLNKIAESRVEVMINLNPFLNYSESYELALKMIP